jgi:hypothetical protein
MKQGAWGAVHFTPAHWFPTGTDTKMVGSIYAQVIPPCCRTHLLSTGQGLGIGAVRCWVEQQVLCSAAHRAQRVEQLCI